MGEIFRMILIMNLTASAVIAAVMLVRFLLMHSPRRYSYFLWIIVLIRLVCPFAVQTGYGFMPNPSELSGMQAEHRERTAGKAFITGGQQISETDGADIAAHAETTPADSASAGRRQSDEAAAWEGRNGDRQWKSWMSGWWISESTWKLLGWLWFAGVMGFAVYGAAGYLVLSRRLKRYETCALREIGIGHGKSMWRAPFMRIRVRERIQIIESEEIGAPFTAGLFHPVICLPSGLLPAQREIVLMHERTHIGRRDHLIKVIAYLVRSVHWFNPLVWLAFRLFEEDMEISCDEAALHNLGYGRKKDYAKTLLALSGRRSQGFGIYPVSFGEKNTQTRIRNVLSLKQTRIWVIVISTAAVAAAAVLLLVNRKPVSVGAAEAQGMSGGQISEGRIDESGQPEEDGAPGTGDRQPEEGGAPDTGDGQPMEDGAPGTGDGQPEEDGAPGTGDGQPEEDGAPGTGDGQPEEGGAPDTGDRQPTEAAGMETGIDENGIGTQEKLAEISQKITDNLLAEGDICIEERNVGFANGLLCNPQIGESGRQENDFMILYAYPLETGDDGIMLVSASYGSRIHPVNQTTLFHCGIDFVAEKGTPVFAAADGVVYRTGWDSAGGNYVILLHENGEVTYYAHCEKVMESIVQGRVVLCGEQIATVGSTGMSTGAHLHFSVSRNGAYIEPKFADNEIQVGQLGASD